MDVLDILMGLLGWRIGPSQYRITQRKTDITSMPVWEFEPTISGSVGVVTLVTLR
jgi:hypothetical protein